MTRLSWANTTTLQPLDDDATIQITVDPNGRAAGLLTVRAKDQDLTADQFDVLARCCRMAARRLRGNG